MFDKLVGVSAAVFEARVAIIVEREVETAAAAARARAEQFFEAPHTGDEVDVDASPEQYVELKARIVRALSAQKWFAEHEAPPWAGPLPISEDDIVVLANDPDQSVQRRTLVAGFGRLIRSTGYHARPPFENYIAEQLAVAPRRRGRPRKIFQSWPPV